jgi:anti-sigma-K factor RskA
LNNDVQQKHCPYEGDGSKSMWIKVGAGLSAVIAVLFFSACTYTMRRKTNPRTGMHVICTESLGTKNFILYIWTT